MLIDRIHIRNLLSFGDESRPIDLRGLNVIIGPNGSGKSNLIECIGLLQATPRSLYTFMTEAGGFGDWLWQGKENPCASMEVCVRDAPPSKVTLNHRIALRSQTGLQRWRTHEICSESVECWRPETGHSEPEKVYEYADQQPVLYERADGRELVARPLKSDAIVRDESVLSQVRDPERYPSLTYLSQQYSGIRIYRDWVFGRHAPARQEQKADLPGDELSANGDNLAMVINSIEPGHKGKILEALNALYPGIDDFHVRIGAGRVQLFLKEGKFLVPATRLSDGTLRFLCLIAILLHPAPPPLICIEEPELGLHPDALPAVARLLRIAAEWTQIIVTTHSDILIDCFTEEPESVLVCDKENGQTQMRRFAKNELRSWLEKYSLGQLWLEGEIGGKRW